MAGKRDDTRVTVQAGNFAVHEVCEYDAYAMDPREDFMTWSICAAGAFDYPADKLGFGYGAVVERNEKYWALRVGYFLAANEPNASEFDMELFRRGGYIA